MAIECSADAACPAAVSARLCMAEVVRQALDGSAILAHRPAEGGQRWAATASSTGGREWYPLSLAPSTTENAAETEVRILAEKGAFQDFATSS